MVVNTFPIAVISIITFLIIKDIIVVDIMVVNTFPIGVISIIRFLIIADIIIVDITVELMHILLIMRVS